MDVLLLLFGPLLLAFLVTAAMPDGRIGVGVGLVCAALGVMGASAPLGPAAGPDDFLRGSDQAASALAVVAALAATVAQAIRWRAGLGPGRYLLTLAGTVAAAVVLTALMSPYLPF